MKYQYYPQDSCGCNDKYYPMHNTCGIMPNMCDNMPLAMAYVPFQKWSTPLEPCIALEMGTLFEELYLPFTGRR